MARALRCESVSEGNYYHVTARGAGRRAIFDDDIDRSHYLELLWKFIGDSSGSLVAWCLMDNHVHLLFHMELYELSRVMHRLHTAYAQYFNGRHGHVGPVFQGRFDSQPLNTDEHLLLAVAYIHRNPKDIQDGSWSTYPWSSYLGYLDGSARCETGVVMDLLEGPDGFVAFHESTDVFDEVRLDGYRRRLNDAEARKALEIRMGAGFADALATLPKGQRDMELVALHEVGLSARQIERLTGIGRNMVNRAISANRK